MRLPVLIASGCACSQSGKEMPNMTANPKTNKFLDEFRSTYCRFDRPTAIIIPIYQHKPIIGLSVGTRTKCPRTKCPELNVPDKMSLEKSPRIKCPRTKCPWTKSPCTKSPWTKVPKQKLIISILYNT